MLCNYDWRINIIYDYNLFHMQCAGFACRNRVFFKYLCPSFERVLFLSPSIPFHTGVDVFEELSDRFILWNEGSFFSSHGAVPVDSAVFVNDLFRHLLVVLEENGVGGLAALYLAHVLPRLLPVGGVGFEVAADGDWEDVVEDVLYSVQNALNKGSAQLALMLANSIPFTGI